MQQIPLRPIWPAGWAFVLVTSLHAHTRGRPFRAWALLMSSVLWPLLWISVVVAQPHDGEHRDTQHAVSHRDWEGSREGVAYSEFNHRVAGIFLMVIGMAEMSHALWSSSWRSRVLLPAALGGMGLFLLIWSDHEAWPVGSLSLTETLLGGDREILQHKVYGTLALVVACVEILRRTGRLRHPGWLTPLPAFAIVGGVMLFAHSHGAHPFAHHIARHHAVMGTLAIMAGVSRLISAWKAGSASLPQSRWELLWAGLVLIIGAQLLLYSES